MKSLSPVVVDVYQLIKGRMPLYQSLMQVVHRLEKGEELIVKVPFKPTSLISIMNRRGYHAIIRQRFTEPRYTVHFVPRVSAEPPVR
jgi:hypothetical protein